MGDFKLKFIFACVVLTLSLGSVTAFGASESKPKSGADSEEGWVTRRTKDGKFIKVPRKQVFRFGDSDISGNANRPAETILSPRLTPHAVSLIPERSSYRNEMLETVGYLERRKK